jgi:hypothetical protein
MVFEFASSIKNAHASRGMRALQLYVVVYLYSHRSAVIGSTFAALLAGM